MTTLARQVQARVRDGLAASGDPVRAQAQQRYMKSAMPFAGVPVPAVRRLVRGIVRDRPPADADEWRDVVGTLFDQAKVREERYAALDVLRRPPRRDWLTPQVLPLLRHLIVSGAWWDLVDDVATHPLRQLRLDHPQQLDPVLRRWADDDDLWLRRSAVIVQVGAGDATDVALLADVLEPNLDRREFFLRKAVGWALRDASGHHPEWVRTYVADHDRRLSSLSRREATRRLPALDPEVTRQ